MTSPTRGANQHVNVRRLDGESSVVEAIVESAIELGIDPAQTSTSLQDTVDVDALTTLVKEASSTESTLHVSFDVWDINYVVTPLSVVATSLA
ncbi:MULTISPECIES: HalOD1 output domain-containing protein [Haloferax]|uniref:HalOD1 output domain-containing protein n=1 Tax=Haloferax TaxID=2251 RepID=UPI00177D5FAD